jgi:DNA-binding IclR family transcriptional regulator
VVTPGERIWAHATAAGKALLARLSDAELGRVLGARLPGYTRDTVRTLPALLRELATTRRRGWAVMRVLEALGQSLLKTAEGLATWARGSTS